MIAELDVQVLTDWLDRVSKRYVAEQAFLCDLDAAIGDGDHGANLARGFSVGVAKLGAPASPAVLFKTMGMTLIGTVGGASGPLYGTLFIEMGKAAGNQAALDVASWAQILARGLAGVMARGKAQRGDKTMIDALEPAVQALREASDLATALTASAAAAKQGAAATTQLIALKGRASYLGERAIGHQDPGATSLAMLLEELAVIGA
jgi:phosphoenolpyruvate---glycerone phosphotransferase subunit DhaL